MANETNIELLIQAKNLTDEAFKKVLDRLKEVQDQSDDTTGKGKTSWGKWFATIAGGVTVGNLVSDAFETAAGMVARLPGQLIALGQRGNDVADVAESFDKLTGSIGESGDAVLGKLRQAFGGIIPDFDLMQSVNEGLSKGLKITGDDMAILAKASRVMSDQIGGDSKTKFESMIDAIASGRDKALRQLPLDYAKIEKSVKGYADALGVEVGALTNSQQREALRLAVLKEAQRIIQENGEVQNDFNDNIAAGQAQLTNWTDALGVAIQASPSLNAALGFVSDSMISAFGNDKTRMIQTVTEWVNKTAIFLVDVASAGVSVGKYVGMAFGSVVGAVLDSIGYIQTFNAGLLKTQAYAYELLAKLPGKAGDAYAQLATDARRGADEAGKSADTYHQKAEATYSATVTLADGADKFNAALGTMRERMVAASKEQISAEAITKALAKAHKTTTDAVDGESKAHEDLAKKVRAMSVEVADAMAHGQLDSWAKRNANALKELIERSAEMGQKVPANIRKAMLDAAKLGLDEDAAKRTDVLRKQALDNLEKYADAGAAAFQKANDQIVASDKAAADARAKRTLSEYDYQVHTIQQEAAERKRALDTHSSNYAAALDAIDRETAEKMEDAKNIHNQKLAEMKAATNSWGNLTRKWLGEIPGLLQAAFTGGGGFGGAMKGLFSGIGGDIGDKLFGGPTGLGAKLAGSLVSKGLGPDIAAKFGGLLGQLGGPLGSMVMNFGLGLGKKLFGALFGSAGRDEVKKFADSLGGFDDLHTKLGALGAQGEQLWIKLTQGVGRNNPEQAKKVIDEITQALAHIPPTLADAAAQAGFQTTASLTKAATDAVKLWEYMRDSGSYTADQVQQAWEKAQEALRHSGDASVSALQKSYDAAQSNLKALDDQIASLQKSIDSEAPEAVMGVVEAQARARLKALQQERDAAAKHVEEIQDQLRQSMDRVATALENLPHELDIHVRTHFDDDNSHDTPHHASGAYIRQDHVAQVHGGEIVGPIDFMTRALVGAFQSISPSGAGAPMLAAAGGGLGDMAIHVYVGNEQLDARTVKVAKRAAVTGRMRTRANAGRSY